jgi:hypothetical protein
MKWFLALLFLVQVEIPFGPKVTYIAEKFMVVEGCYEIHLKSGERVWVPITFTIIKEKKDD